MDRNNAYVLLLMVRRYYDCIVAATLHFPSQLRLFRVPTDHGATVCHKVPKCQLRLLQGASICSHQSGQTYSSNDCPARIKNKKPMNGYRGPESCESNSSGASHLARHAIGSANPRSLRGSPESRLHGYIYIVHIVFCRS